MKYYDIELDNVGLLIIHMYFATYCGSDIK